jgi:ubiquinone/menaquinone biosynthesis C-methylase UbiE
MDIRDNSHPIIAERMSDISFRLMNLTFNIIDLLSDKVERRAQSFGLQPGMVVVDYGCGPGRYTLRFSKLVGESGQVFAVDIHELAIQAVSNKMARYTLNNVQTVLAHGYNTGLPDQIADRVFALDMFFAVHQPTVFLAELKRITKPQGMLIIEDGHQPREVSRRKILNSGFWKIENETVDQLECRPV